MSGLQHIRHIGRERQIQLMANRKGSGIKSIISSDSIDLQQVAARIVIRIGMVILDKPLGIQIIGSTGIEIVLPAMFCNHKKSAAHSGNHIKDLSVPCTHGGQANRAGSRVCGVVSSEVFAEKNSASRTDVIGYFVRPRVSERSTSSVYLLKINGFAHYPSFRHIQFVFPRH